MTGPGGGLTRPVGISAEVAAMLRHLPSGLAIYHLVEGGLQPLFRNPAFYRVLGYSEEHVAQIQNGMSFLGVHQEDLPQLKQKTQKLLEQGGTLAHTVRVFHDKSGVYRWIHVEGARQITDGGEALVYAVYTDVTGETQLKTELTTANEKMQDIINAIPGGVAVYRVTDGFQTVYFSDGVPALTGYTVEEYQVLIQGDAAQMIYAEDRDMVVQHVRQTIQEHTVADFEFRKRHRDGHIVWVRVQARQIGEEDGAPLLHCVFHNISDLKETQLEMNHLINAIPGGVASYQLEAGELVPTFYSDGMTTLSGYSRAEFEALGYHNIMDLIYQGDQVRVKTQIEEAMRTGQVLNVSYRVYHKDGSLVWVHLNGRRIGPLTDWARFYVSFTGISPESRMYQEIANEAADAIYVVDRENYDLLYLHEAKQVFAHADGDTGQKCYRALHGRDEPCPFCSLIPYGVPGEEYEVPSPWNDKVYSLRFRETDWNGIPAYIQYLQDITEEVRTRQEKERLEQYFHTLVESLPGGVGVVRRHKDGTQVPEYLSAGFAAMTGATPEQAWAQYQENAMAGVHPEDLPGLMEQLSQMEVNHHYEMTYRLRHAKEGYFWVKSTLAMQPSQEEGEMRIYMFLRDVTEERREQDRMREQYREILLQHYQTPSPNDLMVGHCNITGNRILEIIDYTQSGVVERFGTQRDVFFTALSQWIPDQDQRQQFLDTFLSQPLLQDYQQEEKEQVMDCYLQIPGEETGRYVQNRVTLVKEPDTGDITGILTMTDITEQVVADRVLRQLSEINHDYIIVLDLYRDWFTTFNSDQNAECMPASQGSYSNWIRYFLENRVVPKDQDTYRTYLNMNYMTQRLRDSGTYTFDYALTDDDGSIYVKRMTVFEIDLRLGRVGLSRTDVTETKQEQQGLLNMLAYTFELVSFIEVNTGRMTMHTRQTVLEDLTPYVMEDYDAKILTALKAYGTTQEEQKEMGSQLQLPAILENLKAKPRGYDFVCGYQSRQGLRYKKINIMWGDRNHQTVCVVRADVTEMLAGEREHKQALEEALSQAEAANRAKSAFLSAVSHDIRTPMNAIMGMTALAEARSDDPGYVAQCLGKITVSSKHLLNLINDVLDMSKIERAEVTLNRERLSLDGLMDQVITMIRPQAAEKGQQFQGWLGQVTQKTFYGDGLRINQILINILGNAVKFTPPGGTVDFWAENCPAQDPDRVRFRFSIRDTGVGMSADSLSHIFEPFTRGQDVARVEGTGLGLSITKGLVDHMGGTITVDSQKGVGSLFQVELEFDPVRQEDLPAPAEEPPALETEDRFLQGCHFLVAEDNAINAEILTSLLELCGAETTVEPNGAQTVEAFSAAPPGTYDAILMDIQMPVMNGYQAARAIRALARPDAGTISMIAMTANAFAEDVQAALDAGMNAHVAKPIDLGLLKATLRRVLDPSL